MSSDEKSPAGYVAPDAAAHDDHDADVMCGVGSWRPRCLQRLATHRVYAIAYIVIGIVQGMIMSYFSGVLTTLEKVFGVQSSTMGIVMAGNDISQILGGLLVNHFGSRGSRPVWVAIGMVTTGASCFMYACCHLLWDGSNYTAMLTSSSRSTLTTAANRSASPDLCSPNDAGSNNDVPDALAIVADDSDRNTVAVLLLMFGGQLISGVGSTALFSLGFTYMDDSVKKKSAPMYTGITTSLRCLGPVLGFLLASFSLGFNVIPTVKSPYQQRDPLYIGAWWLGFLILGSLQVLITFPMLLFPKMLPSEKAKLMLMASKMEVDNMQPKLTAWKDFKESLIRVLKNPVVIAYLLSIGPLILGIVCSGIFLPKYLEAQFGQTPQRASSFAGLSGMATIMAGTFLGGLIMWKFQPRALYVASFSFAVDILHIVCTVFMMLFDCGKDNFVGIDLHSGGSYTINSACSQNCNCRKQFNPVCIGSETFLSPCLAGCIQGSRSNNRIFQNCTCAAASFVSTLAQQLATNSSGTSIGSWTMAKSGFCPGGRQDCPYLLPYLTLNGVSKLFGSIARIGFILILIRSVEKRDKSLVMALMLVIGSLTGFIPGPIVFGAAVDEACLVWEEKSRGQRGHCWIYDSQKFSYWFHGIKITCYSIMTALSLFVCYYGRRINLYDEDGDTTKHSQNGDIPLENKPEKEKSNL